MSLKLSSQAISLQDALNTLELGCASTAQHIVSRFPRSWGDKLRGGSVGQLGVVSGAGLGSGCSMVLAGGAGLLAHQGASRESSIPTGGTRRTRPGCPCLLICVLLPL